MVIKLLTEKIATEYEKRIKEKEVNEYLYRFFKVFDAKRLMQKVIIRKHN